jgi:hypothetical protein
MPGAKRTAALPRGVREFSGNTQAKTTKRALHQKRDDENSPKPTSRMRH